MRSTCSILLFVLTVSQLQAAPDLPPPIRSAKSGAWSEAATWEGGKVPPALARVLIREGHTVVYDLKSDQVIRAINVAGMLRFATDKDTRLDVGLIKIQAGDAFSEEGFDCQAHLVAPDPSKPRPALEIGTLDHPIDAQHTALIRLTYIEGMNKETCPAIICCAGRMDLHGAPLSHAWVKLGETAKAGDPTVVLAEPVQGWKVGDHIIVTTTGQHTRPESVHRGAHHPGHCRHSHHARQTAGKRAPG